MSDLRTNVRFMAGRARPSHKCTECGAVLAKWVGRCPDCQAWSSVVEVASTASASAGLRGTLAIGTVTRAARPIADVPLDEVRAVPTGITELDRVLGGGLVGGSSVLLAGEPGVGKSTLLLEVAAAAARAGRRALIVSGEESAGQIRLRAERTGAVVDGLWLAAETELAALLAHVEEVKPDLLVVDSVQTIASAEVDGPSGGVTQVKEVTAAMVRVAKTRGIATVLVGHVTKDGAVAGPRTLEHLVDVVLHFEGDRHSSLRLLRAIKNRFGAAEEVGCFEQTEAGIFGVPDPSGLFLSRRDRPVDGTCVTVTLEGRRALAAELQALVVHTGSQTPGRRQVSGVPAARLAMVLAVLAQRSRIPSVTFSDVYASTVGGVRLDDPGSDLAMALAVASAAGVIALPPGTMAIGEIGLAGDVRPVPGIPQRLAEAARLGFTRALVPRHPGPVPPGLKVLQVESLVDAMEAGTATRRIA
jgi:DNA repair protein RadA/Sms